MTKQETITTSPEEWPGKNVMGKILTRLRDSVNNNAGSSSSVPAVGPTKGVLDVDPPAPLPSQKTYIVHRPSLKCLYCIIMF